MRLLEVVAFGGLLTAPGTAVAGFDTVVTLDNGEFNTPLYTPRWNGEWAQPAVAEEIVISIARVTGENPQVYTYLPPGAARGRPGVPFAVAPRLPDCIGPAENSGDPCTCGPADRCWDGIGPNYHPDASTSLYLTAAALRAEMPSPRLEVHFSDLFEEDPAAGDNPRDLDRCVTADGTRKAVAGLFQVAGIDRLDHAAVGILRVRIEPPPPGAHQGYTYDLVQRGAGACWTGAKGGEWVSPRRPIEMAVGVLVLGVGTKALSGDVDTFLSGLTAQFSSEDLSLDLVTIRRPPIARDVSGTLTAGLDPSWRLAAPAHPVGVPCGRASISGGFFSGKTPLSTERLTADCSGSAFVKFAPYALERAFVAQFGLDPRAGNLLITGAISIQSDEDAIVDALSALTTANQSATDRPLPLWHASVPALLDVARPFTEDVTVTSLSANGVDARPWPVIAMVGIAFGALLGAGVFWILQKLQAERALRLRWGEAVGREDDPLRQMPLATVIADAQADVHRSRIARVWIGLLVAVIGSAIGARLMLSLFLVSLD